ncbi:MAG: ATP synthase F1 subunit delta [Candidatus Beckwithbacteria bacterium]|nr:ATP synthase F1 subunit delta [Candidatus Beckwithbacteria bacterium]
MSVDTIVAGIVDYLKSKHQLELLPEVASALTQAGFLHADPNLAEVTTASPLTPGQKQALNQTLTKLLKRPIRLKNKLDKQLIGGLRIAWAGKIIDLSLNEKLKQINESLAYD